MLFIKALQQQPIIIFLVLYLKLNRSSWLQSKMCPRVHSDGVSRGSGGKGLGMHWSLNTVLSASVKTCQLLLNVLSSEPLLIVADFSIVWKDVVVCVWI